MFSRGSARPRPLRAPRVIRGDQVGDLRAVVDAHEPHRQARLVLVRQTGLVQADDPAVVFPGAYREDRRGLLHAIRHLGTRQQRHTAPTRDLVTFEFDAVQGQATLAAFATEGGDGLGRGQQEMRLPAPTEQFIQIVRCRRPTAGGEALGFGDIVQQPEFGVMQQFALLAFADRLDDQPQLLFGLIHRVVVEVRDPHRDLQDGLGRAEFVFTRGRIVIGEGPRQGLALGGTGGQFDQRLGVRVGRPLVVGKYPASGDPVDAPGRLHPGQPVQQPAGGGFLALRDRFGGGRQGTRGGRTQRHGGWGTFAHDRHLISFFQNHSVACFLPGKMPRLKHA